MLLLALICLLCLNVNVYADEVNDVLDESLTNPNEELDEETFSTYITEVCYGSPQYNSNITSYNNFLCSYFDNLTYNIGMNYKGSCGYVALAMLLSYYDTFLSDSIVPEQYDVNSIGTGNDMVERRNSPGVLKDLIADPYDSSNASYGKDMSHIDYYNAIIAMKDSSLHAKLIEIGNNLGYYNFSAKKYPASTNFIKRKNILDNYLKEIIKLDAADYSIDYISAEINITKRTAVRNFTISKIQSGIPVILGIGKENGTGHVVIAYDYDHLTDKIYCHFGWGANETHITPEDKEYTIYKSALAINFNLEHIHSNNYGVTTVVDSVANTEYYCYNNHFITTFNHVHSYDYNYSQFSSTMHKSYCHCEAYVFQNHSLNSNICTFCGHTEHTHSYTQLYKKYNSLQHRSYCLCGEYILENHIVRNSNPNTCIICLGPAGSGSSIIMSKKAQYITDNGSYISGDGIIVLVDEDIESYFDGTLKFYVKEQNQLIEQQ